jgi:hypothetical protein
MSRAFRSSLNCSFLVSALAGDIRVIRASDASTALRDGPYRYGPACILSTVAAACEKDHIASHPSGTPHWSAASDGRATLADGAAPSAASHARGRAMIT